MALNLQNIPEVQAVAEGNSLFSVSVHQELRKTTPGNFIFSALSLSVLAALVKLGARGETADEMVNVFNFPHNDETLRNGYSQVLPTLKESTEGYTLSQANKLYCGVGFELKPEYTAAVTTSFDADIEQVDFSKNITAAKTINEWVQKITKDKIMELITPDLIDGSTRMVLVNGVYFKGSWANKFPLEFTRKAVFFVDEKYKTEVNMMHKVEELPYVELEHLDAHAVALSYKGDRLSMIVYLPKQVSGLARLESGMADLIPSEILPKMDNSTLIDFFMPRFKIESKLLLNEPLINLGMQSAFTPAAELGGMSPENIYISDVRQKAMIEVNEEGTVAAAATSEGVKQELWVNFKGGNSLYFDTHTPDLTKYSALLADAEAICTVGTWMTFLETNYEHHFDSFGLGSVPTCNVASGVFKNTKSLRHYAANETETDALSIYAGTYYNGTEIYVTARAYTGITERQGSVAASGHSSWMLYEGQNLDGFSVCFQVPREPNMYFNYNRLVFMDMATVGSVFKGCDEREIQAYKKLHSL